LIEDVVVSLADIWSTHDGQNQRVDNIYSERIKQAVKDGVEELCNDEDFVYEFERYRHRKKRRTSNSFDSVVDKMMPESLNDENQEEPVEKEDQKAPRSTGFSDGPGVPGNRS